MAKVFLVKQTRGLRGCTVDQRETMRCIGLRKIGHTVEVKDNPANRGQVFKVQHLVEVSVRK